MILKMFKLVKQVKFVTINAQTLRINEIYLLFVLYSIVDAKNFIIPPKILRIPACHKITSTGSGPQNRAGTIGICVTEWQWFQA
jgi:hypothetical protein